MTDPILERYIQIIENNEKTGDVSTDGESTLEIDVDGTKRWRNKQRQLHRRDGPAFEGARGSRFWYINGEQHREDGPAVEYADGYKAWFKNDKLHRLDGPAVEPANGYKSYFINGNPLSEDEFYAYIVNKAIKRKKK